MRQLEGLFVPTLREGKPSAAAARMKDADDLYPGRRVCRWPRFEWCPVRSTEPNKKGCAGMRGGIVGYALGRK
jgi:hypothetical protein